MLYRAGGQRACCALLDYLNTCTHIYKEKKKQCVGGKKKTKLLSCKLIRTP